MMNADSELAIVTTADERYAIPLVALLKSIELNLRTCMPATAYVIDTGLRRRTKALIERGIRTDRLRLKWVTPAEDARLSSVPVFGHVNVSTYYRILVPDILPDLRKVIYLDADMLVLGDLGELWRFPMEGKPLMAVQEIGNTTVASARIPGYLELHLPPDAKVFNGGMLVMDAEQWRTERLPDHILSYLGRYSSEVRYWDQDGLNALLCQRWVELPKMWNWRVNCGVPELSTGLDSAHPETMARILHFSSATKPWHYYCEHPAKRWFFEYLDKTPFRGWRPRPPVKALLNRHFWGARVRRFLGAWLKHHEF